MELGLEAAKNRGGSLPSISRQTDISSPLRRADDSCKHVEVRFACMSPRRLWPLAPSLQLVRRPRVAASSV